MTMVGTFCSTCTVTGYPCFCLSLQNAASDFSKFCWSQVDFFKSQYLFSVSVSSLDFFQLSMAIFFYYKADAVQKIFNILKTVQNFLINEPGK